MATSLEQIAERSAGVALNVSSEIERAVLGRVESGRYESAEAVLQASLDALSREEEYARKVADVRAMLEVAETQIERGQVVDGEQAFAELREHIRRRTGL